METFTREQITKVIEDFETQAFDSPKACFASATSEAFERVKDYFKPLNKDVEDGLKCTCAKGEKESSWFCLVHGFEYRPPNQ